MSDSTSHLPAHASLEQLRKQAKELLRAFRANDPDAVARFRNFKPDLAEPKLTDAQFVIAREHGFASWAKLVQNLDILSVPLGLSSRPPFYRIDWKDNCLEPRQPMSNSDWERVIAVMKELRLTKLNARGQINDEQLALVSQLDHLTHLRIDGCKRLTDQGLSHLSCMSELQQIDLSDHPGGTITDRGLEFLQHLPELRSFQMCWQRGVTDGGIANLRFCDQLENVDLLGTYTGDGAISALRGKKNLRKLKTGREVTDGGLSLLQEFPAFKSTQIVETDLGLMSFEAEPTNLLIDGPFTRKA